jgi:hypothetical protein
MTTMTVTYAPVIGALRDYLRTVASVTALVGQRVYVGGLPKNPAVPVTPAVVVSRVGGTMVPPVDQALVQFDCWAVSGSDAEQLAVTVAGVLDSVAGSTILVSGVRFKGASIVSVNWLPDPASDLPRYIVTAQVVAATTTS